MEGKSTLKIYKDKKWGEAQFIKVTGTKEELTRARGDWMTQARTVRWNGGEERCGACSMAKETREHILWKCPQYLQKRERAKGRDRRRTREIVSIPDGPGTGKTGTGRPHRVLGKKNGNLGRVLEKEEDGNR